LLTRLAVGALDSAERCFGVLCAPCSLLFMPLPSKLLVLLLTMLSMPQPDVVPLQWFSFRPAIPKRTFQQHSGGLIAHQQEASQRLQQHHQLQQQGVFYQCFCRCPVSQGQQGKASMPQQQRRQQQQMAL
jgi:hypothetical protein